MQVAVIGLGYVGAVSAACLAEGGATVVGVDRDPRKVGSVNDRRAPVVEPRLDELVDRHVGQGRLRATTDLAEALAGADVSLVCVGTPSQSNGGLDLEHVERVAEEVGAHLGARDGDHTVVFRSTMLPNTVEHELTPILEGASGRHAGRDFGVAYCPEFLRESTAVDDFFDPPLTVVGANDAASADVVTELLDFLDAPVHTVPVAAAEAVKYACNAFHATKITFANEIARFCDSAGVDGRQVMDLVVEDHRLNISPAYLRPGFSFGGSCLPKDLRALVHRARALDLDLPMLGGLIPSNDQHLREAVRWVLEQEGRRIAMLGLSFKPGTDDLRDSPLVELAETLIGKGLELSIHDPVVGGVEGLIGTNLAFAEERLPHLCRMLVPRPEDALEGADVAIVGTRAPGLLEALRDAGPPAVLDLVGSWPELELLPGCHGLAW
jgi:GDP-mannose 6-dehydrogenase